MRKFLAAFLSVFLIAGGALAANPIPYFTGAGGTNPSTFPADMPDLNALIQTLNTQGAQNLGTGPCTATGTSPQTCNGQRGLVTTGTLTTAAAAAASFTINDSSVASTSVVLCMNDGYSGTVTTNGNPVIAQCVPGAGTITVSIYNAAAANALNGTVTIGFMVLN